MGNDARPQQAVATSHGAGADATGERVREQAGKLAASANCPSSDSGTADRSKTATRAAMVLSGLFQRADKRAGELANAYDAARIAGKAREASYSSLSGRSQERIEYEHNRPLVIFVMRYYLSNCQPFLVKVR